MLNSIVLGGTQAADEERIYPKDATFRAHSGELVSIRRSAIPGLNMDDLFARHKARYYQVGLFCRPGNQVLDFPCGPGYAAEVLAPLGITYHGLDIDPVTVQYAEHIYGSFTATFSQGDLCNPTIPKEQYEVIGCIEGLEHIAMEHQDRLIAALHDALMPHGVLVVTSPENQSGVSGQSPHNKWHVGELTKKDFLALLQRHFPAEKVELVTHSAVLSTGIRSNCFYGICHK